jgi:uncharacterized protein (UPF0303 family)
LGTEEMLAAIRQQEVELTFEHFDEDDAWLLGCGIRDRAKASGMPLVVRIMFFHRELFLASLPGSTPDNLEWARKKGNVVRHFQRSSYGVGLELAARRATLQDLYGLPIADYAAHGGGFPLRVQSGGVLGAVVVSGLPQREDHMLVVGSLCVAQGRDIARYQLPG